MTTSLFATCPLLGAAPLPSDVPGEATHDIFLRTITESSMKVDTENMLVRAMLFEPRMTLDKTLQMYCCSYEERKLRPPDFAKRQNLANCCLVISRV